MSKPVRHPKITLVMAIHNCEAYLEETFNSLPLADSDLFEVIAIVNGSTDKSLEIAKSCLTGKTHKVIETSVASAGYAVNYGVSLAHGQYIAIVDGDDISTPARFYDHYQHLEKHPEHTAVGGQCVLFDKTGHTFESNLFSEPAQIWMDSLFRVPLFLGAGMIRKSALQEIPYPHMPSTCDWWVLQQLLQRGHLMTNLPQISLKYRQHTQNVTKGFRSDSQLASEILGSAQLIMQASGLIANGVKLTDTELVLFNKVAQSSHKLFANVCQVHPDEIPAVDALFSKIEKQVGANQTFPTSSIAHHAFNKVSTKHIQWMLSSMQEQQP